VSAVGPESIEQRAINTIRGLAMDGPQAANSGHPGTAMALAPLATVLWTRIMRYDPQEPEWFDRDRFVLSAGHASILLYSMLHLTGYDLSLDDLRAFRQWGSRTPGHPEVHHTSGVEVTTGPLGQGFANGVGMAMAEQHVRHRYGADVCDHRIFAICSDGDLQEGISHEAASLAGHLALGRLVYVYDDNHISIDGPTELSFTDDTARRFEAYGWHVLDLGEAANDVGALEAGVREAMAEEERPSLVILRSHIGWPSPKFTDTADAHGNPLGEDEIRVTKELLGLPPDETFHVPAEVAEWFRAAAGRHRDERVDWERRVVASAHHDELECAIAGHGMPGWSAKLPTWEAGGKVATRKASGACMNAVLDVVPGLMAGGADLTGNTGTKLDDVEVLAPTSRAGRQVHWGVREHAMCSVMNGMAMHHGVLPVGGTFFIFSDYARPAIRLAAIMQAHVIFSFSHDSVGVGEDGPTHQPIEHLASLRAVPGLLVVRPADANECAQAWKVAVDHDGPVLLVLSRQDLPVLEGTSTEDGLSRGGYVLRDSTTPPALVLIGTGSEVAVCVDAAAALEADGIPTRVVSLPSWELFEVQGSQYQEAVLPVGIPRLSVEAGSTFGWSRWADASVGIDRFGASAPGEQVLHELGINAEHVVEEARRLLSTGR
jgi:transketolase